MYGYLYCENGGLEWLLDDMGFVPNLSINAENLHLYVFGTLHARAGSTLRTHASWLRVQADSCLCIPRASLALLFQK